jgi:hypothetical protein
MCTVMNRNRNNGCKLPCACWIGIGMLVAKIQAMNGVVGLWPQKNLWLSIEKRYSLRREIDDVLSE